MGDTGAVLVAGVKTTCPYCGVGCGVIARPDSSGGWSIVGDPEHPANFGRLCSKGSTLAETLSTEDRLLHPLVHGRRVSWEEALTAVANGFRRTIDRYGPEAVGFYLSGQLLTEDYYLANKLMKGFLGSANVDTNSRLCMASSVAGHKRAFGSDTVPGCYADLDEADLIVLVGSNAAWCHPVLHQRMLANQQRRGCQLVVIDPRRTATADVADLHLAIKPGTDALIFAGLLVHLADRGALDAEFIHRRTTGFENALACARDRVGSVPTIAQSSGVSAVELQRFYDWFVERQKTVTCYSQGVNQSAEGTDKVNGIINCHLATGRIGKPGMGPFSLTGQPNAMGGREVGGMANQLAAHMEFDAAAIDRVCRYWQARNMARREGLKAVQLFEAAEEGRIKALWIMATNPAVSLPRADAMRAALRRLDLLVVSDNVVASDTVDAAHIKLPAAAWGERDGTVTNSERRISRQRAFLRPPGEAKPDWWIVSEVAKRLGFVAQFTYASAADIFREHAALSSFENGGTRDFDIGGLSDLSGEAYDALTPVQWPVPSAAHSSTARLFDGSDFFTDDKRARFVAPATPTLAAPTDTAYPFLLNTGRIRDQWHTMTRTGKSPRLSQHIVEPFVELHPRDAESVGLAAGGLARVRTTHGEAILRVVISDGQLPGSLFAPIHWSSDNASRARVGALVHAVVDPVSGQPDAKATPATIEPIAAEIHGFLLARQKIDPSELLYWVRVPVGRGYLYTIALDRERDPSWRRWLQRLCRTKDGEVAEYSDESAGLRRVACISGGRLQACAFLSRSPVIPSWAWLTAQFECEMLDGPSRRALLAGRPIDSVPDQGPLICVCFAVGYRRIAAAIREQSLTTLDDIGAALKAGTNCGSCVPELRRILQGMSCVSLADGNPASLAVLQSAKGPRSPVPSMAGVGDQGVAEAAPVGTSSLCFTHESQLLGPLEPT